VDLPEKRDLSEIWIPVMIDAETNPVQRPRSLADIVTDRLRDDIVRGRYDLGTVLRETSLAHNLGVSRTPVREALMRLEMEGLVVVTAPRGASVFQPSRKELEDICDLRVSLESSALTFAVRRDRQGIAGALKDIVDRMAACRKRNDIVGYLDLDTRFHATFFDHCDNIYLSDAYQTIAAKMAALRNRLGDHPDHMAKSFVEHRWIGEAVTNGEIDKALDILEGHIGRKEGSYWKL
jgi:DNA-binding GntR family transcriptional regulator